MKPFLSIALCSLLAIGCGGGDTPDLGYVSGTITIDGKPAANLLVNFQPTGEGRGSTGLTDADGNFVLEYTPGVEGAILGEHLILLEKVSGDTEDDYASEEDGLSSGLPPKAIDGSLKKVVEAGSQNVKIEL